MKENGDSLSAAVYFGMVSGKVGFIGLGAKFFEDDLIPTSALVQILLQVMLSWANCLLPRSN